jgi:large conductance mechanosensitive channel
MQELWADFRKFMMRGNVLDLAVAVVIGVAFNAVVNSLVNDGRFLTVIVNFVIIAATLFVVIKAFEQTQKRRGDSGEDVAEDKSDEIVLLTEIRDLLSERRS